MNKSFVGSTIVLCILAVASPGAISQSAKPYSADQAERIRAMESIVAKKEHALQHLSACLYDESVIVRQAAAEKLAALGEPATDAIRESLKNSSPAVRRIAFLALKSLDKITYDDMSSTIKDPNEVLRWEVVQLLVKMDMTEKVKELLTIAQTDSSKTIREMARLSLWEDKFQVKSKKLCEQFPDRAIETVHTFKLPSEGWKFKRDTAIVGHVQNWYNENYPESDWNNIKIEKPWQDFGHDYQGIGWYRCGVYLPVKIGCDGAEIHFQGVDEAAWVWINGEYIGKHDIGLNGWDKPFTLAIPLKSIKWGAKNQITVRVSNVAYAGGIWKPVSIDFLKVK